MCALLVGGGYAEQVCVPQAQVLPVPAGVALEDAAALPEVVCTVWSNVFMTANLLPGQFLLVHGGSSGIGTMAIQLAREIGARVAVTAGSAEKLEACRQLGAEMLVNYREQDFVEEVRAATGGAGADVILDNMGAKYLARNVDVLAVNGRLVVIGLQGGTKAEVDLNALLRKRAALIATSLRARPAEEKATIVAAVREHVWPLVEAGRVKPIVHSRFALADAAAAHREMESSRHIGKILLTPDPLTTTSHSSVGATSTGRDILGPAQGSCASRRRVRRTPALPYPGTAQNENPCRPSPPTGASSPSPAPSTSSPPSSAGSPWP